MSAYGHIQEVIIQNFRAKPEIPMADAPEPDALRDGPGDCDRAAGAGSHDERAGAAESFAA